GVGHLEKWAEMMQVLKDISANRMPSVADLLKAASQAPATAESQPSKKNPMAGQMRSSPDGKGSPPADKPSGPKPAVPQIVDSESSQQPKAKQTGDEEPPPPGKGQAPLRLPVTTVMGDGKGKKGDACPVEDKVEEAIK